MTNAPLVARALVDLIGRSPAFATRQVTISHPGSLAEEEMVTVLGIRASENFRTLGKDHKREELVVELGLVAEVNSDDAEDCLDRAWLMFSDLEEVIAGNPTLGLSQVLYAHVSQWDQRSFVGDGKRTVEITVDVSITANKDLEV